MSEGTGGAEANSDVAVACTDPDFISYLLDPEQEYNCYFVVGNKTLQNVERIGVVKKMLLAHSVVLRAELQDSKIAEKNDVLVTDLFPDTFKNLLRYVYGHDNTAYLSFDEVDNLLYAAEKYMMTKLKNKLATRLMSMLDYSNICSLMNNPACYTVLELNSAITEILQMETHQVLASPQFMNLCPDGFMKILEQDTLDIPEIELWRSALKWAKQRNNSCDGQDLRRELSTHLQHLRICTLTAEDFCNEVVPSRILTYDEVVLICQSNRDEEMQTKLSSICSITTERDRPWIVNPDVWSQSLRTNDYIYGYITHSTMILRTLDNGIELNSLELYGTPSHHECSYTLTLQKGEEISSRITLSRSQPGTIKTIPLSISDKNVKLLPNSSYSLELTFTCSGHHETLYPDQSPGRIFGNHFQVDFLQHRSSGHYLFHVNKIVYKAMTKKVRQVSIKK